jgi:hypothetical protein
MIQDFYLDYLNDYQLKEKQNKHFIFYLNKKKNYIRRDNFLTIDTGLAILDIDIVGTSGFGC